MEEWASEKSDAHFDVFGAKTPHFYEEIAYLMALFSRLMLY
jgi:hypothetical protein